MDAVTNALMTEFVQEYELLELAEDKQFEHFSAFSVVSSRHAEEFDTDDLVAGDGGDLNVDAFAVVVNGRLVNDADAVDDLLELNGYLDIEFIIIQSKTTSRFDGASMLALGDNVLKEVFADTQSLPVNDDIKRLLEIKERIFSHATKLRKNPSCRIYYVCTGTWNDDQYLSSIIVRKRDELQQTNLFSEVEFTPIGARELQTMYRSTRTSISKEVKFEKLVTLPTISDVTASYLGVLPFVEYIKLISDDDGNILKSVFVDNVRDFQGENPVNTDIANTITEGQFDQFVLRNNGITIVARNIRVTSSQFTLDDYQIVNGCQTSHVIFANQNAITGDLFVPLKLIHTENEEVAQSVIRSTNKQTTVEDNDLLALTQFQRNLEDYFGATDGDLKLYYERRAKQYANVPGIEKGRITTIAIQLKSFSSMFLEYSHQAGRYQGTLLKAVKSSVFQSEHQPEPYYTAAFAFYRFEVSFRRLPAADRIMRSFKYFILLAFRFRYEDSDFPGARGRGVQRYCETLNTHLCDVDSVRLVFDECVEIVQEALDNLSLPLERDSAKSRPLVDEVIQVAMARNPRHQEPNDA